MLRVNIDRFHDDNPQDAVGGTSAPSVARRYARRAVDRPGSITPAVLSAESSQRSALRLSRRRPGHALGSADALHQLHARRLRAVHHRTIALLEPVRPSGAVLRHAVLVARHAPRPLRREPDPPHVRRHRQRARHRRARHLHVQEHDHRALRSTDAGRRAAVHAADQLRHQHLQPEAVALHRLRAGQHSCAPRSHDRSRPALRPRRP